MWWNRDRVQSIAAVATWRGLDAHARARPHASVLDAMVDHEDQAAGLGRMIEAANAEARARAESAARRAASR